MSDETKKLKQSMIDYAAKNNDRAVFRSALSSKTVVERHDVEGEKYDKEKSARLSAYMERMRKRRADAQTEFDGKTKK